jgi:FixJ family two-component response regulator
MPGRCGTELAAEIRRRWPALPVLLLTGFDDDPGVRAAHESGLVWDVIAKPWQATALKSRITAALDARVESGASRAAD